MADELDPSRRKTASANLVHGDRRSTRNVRSIVAVRGFVPSGYERSVRAGTPFAFRSHRPACSGNRKMEKGDRFCAKMQAADVPARRRLGSQGAIDEEGWRYIGSAACDRQSGGMRGGTVRRLWMPGIRAQRSSGRAAGRQERRTKLERFANGASSESNCAGTRSQSRAIGQLQEARASRVCS
jgi:hypothetical protein